MRKVFLLLVVLLGTALTTQAQVRFLAIPGSAVPGDNYAPFVPNPAVLALDLNPGTVICNGNIVTYAGGSVTLTASATNYVYLDQTNNCTPTVNTSGFTTTSFAIAVITTTSTAVSYGYDYRYVLGATGAGGGGGGSMTWPGGAGIACYSGSSSWCSSYGPSNLIPTSYIPAASTSQLGLIEIGGDLTGTDTSQSVTNLSHVTNGSLANSGLGHSSTTVNSQTCTLGGTCTIPLETNGANNTSQAGVNFETSVTNAVGLTVTPVNSSSNIELFEITGNSYTGNAATATAFASYTNYSVYGSGSAAGSWITPTADSQCLMAAATNYATTTPSFQTCPSGSGGGTPPNVLGFTSAISGSPITTLTIGSACGSSTPCNVRVGNTVTSYTSPATADITSGTGSGSLIVYITASAPSTLAVLYQISSGTYTVTCTGCTATQTSPAGSTPVFPTNSVPIASVEVVSGAYTGLSQQEAGLATPSYLADGSTIGSTTSAGVTTFLVNQNLTLTSLSLTGLSDNSLVCTSSSSTLLTTSGCLGSGGSVGVNVYTSSHTLGLVDNNAWVEMNCTSACTVTLPTTQPSTTFSTRILTIGSTVATVALGGSDTFNGTTSVPALNSFRPMSVQADSTTSTNYVGDAPLVAGTNVTFTTSANGLTITASGGSSVTASPQYELAFYPSAGTVATVEGNPGITTDANDDLNVTNLSTTSVPLAINAITGQSGDLADFDVNGSQKARIASGGSIYTGGNFVCTASCFLDSSSVTATITIGGGSDGTSSNLGNVSLLGETNTSTGQAGSAYVEGGQNTSTGKQGFTQIRIPAIISTALSVVHELVCPTTTAYTFAACGTSATNWIGESENTGTGSVTVVIEGTATIVFDGTPTVGDYVCVGTTTAGYAHDNSTTPCSALSDQVGYVYGDVSGTGSGATATVVFAR